ncbi:ligase-associated DNA damage response endonuclease PdeM [Pedobacter boryungensis]|uniref:Ligase-associated DNA damage response endonuclease PdeM n=1 Tax=Pedobacter boryungensis TaxID=869962 RepID=A0ABX2DC00_9SPHI|nr:ligase-associated DNA damage response endonuclease PdeM [Pedobacter boryungensis]NQX30694.1 ligase-associated DNA damage response endonuclease PdeM [Pedobacter boryungensis]
MTITIRNEELILAKERAIYLPKEQLLAISDLHLGKAAHFRKAGLQVPSTLAQNDLNRLSDLLNEYQPKTLLINGDMFHHEVNTDIDDFEHWKEQYPTLKFVLVKGNHDKLDQKQYQKLGIEIQDPSYCTENFCFIHDAVKCTEENLYPISGHIHPGISVYGKAKQSLKFPCFYFGNDYAVMPAFSAFTGLSLVKPKATEQVYAITPTKVIKV